MTYIIWLHGLPGKETESLVKTSEGKKLTGLVFFLKADPTLANYG